MLSCCEATVWLSCLCGTSHTARFQQCILEFVPRQQDTGFTVLDTPRVASLCWSMGVAFNSISAAPIGAFLRDATRDASSVRDTGCRLLCFFPFISSASADVFFCGKESVDFRLFADCQYQISLIVSITPTLSHSNHQDVLFQLRTRLQWLPHALRRCAAHWACRGAH